MQRVFRILFRNFLAALAIFMFASVSQAKTESGARFGDWTYECHTSKSSGEFCVLSQLVRAPDSDKRVMKVTLGRYGMEKELTLVALLPLGIYLPAGVVGRVDNTPEFQMTLRTCTALGCEAVIRVSPKMRWRMRVGKELIIGFTAAPGAKALKLPLSLAKVWSGMQAIGEQ